MNFRKKYFKWLLLLLVSTILLGCGEKNNASPPQSDNASSSQMTFNASDKMMSSNGNMAVAAAKMAEEKPEAVWKSAQDISASDLTKSPFSSLGKLCKMTGRIYKIEEFPPGIVNGHWTEIVMLARNKNSPLGTSNISFMYNGDISKINSGDRITCAGYYIGNYESQNAMGGTLEGIAIMGNVFKIAE